MATETPRLTVKITPTALKHLDQIWDWNVDKYGFGHADQYIAFLRQAAEGLGTTYLEGKPIPTNSEYRYLTIKRRRRGQGHLVVYSVIDDVAEVLAFYHTSQDWQGRIERGEF